MPDQTVVDQFPKSAYSKEQVQEIQKNKLDNGAKSCDLSEDDSNWILTTVWPGV
jgi:hypothetical protein